MNHKVDSELHTVASEELEKEIQAELAAARKAKEEEATEENVQHEDTD